MILPNTDAPGVLAAARRFGHAIGTVEMEGLRLGASIGMGGWIAGDEVDADGLLARAGQAMYRAKRGGLSVAEA